MLVTRGGDRDQVLSLLHPNGRAVITRLAGLGPVTLVLDECHHLLALWGHVLEAIIGELHPESAVVGLTATPPLDLVDREAALYGRLFGRHADFEIVTPAVVKDGYLAPYQELAYLTRPTEAEERWIARQQERFDGLLADLLDPSFATVPFGAWFATRVLERRSPEGAPVGWATLERDSPDLARAALRWLWKQGLKPPAGAHLREEHRQLPDAADWIALLDAYCSDVLRPSTDPYDDAALERIRRALPSVGYVLTRRGIRGATSVVDRVLGLSAAKANAAVRILEAEHAALGDRLRALVLCDYEVAGRETTSALRGVLDPGTGSAAATLRELLGTPSTAALDPILVSGRTVAASRSTALALISEARRDPETAPLFEGFDPLADRPDHAGWEDVVIIDPAHPAWSPRTWVPLVTAFYERGGTRCLVGTRALLGEGWNSRTANVLIDLGAATTSVSVQQVRGRTLRLDPADPGKVADNWDVVVVAEGHLRGSADYARFVRKHGHDFALNAAGEVESGVSHVDSVLSPFGPPPGVNLDSLTTTMLGRAATRPTARAAWRIGQPYRDVTVETVRIRLGRFPGLPGRRLFRAGPSSDGEDSPGVVLAVGSVAATGAVAGGLLVGVPLAGGIGAVVVGGATGSRPAGLRAGSPRGHRALGYARGHGLRRRRRPRGDEPRGGRPRLESRPGRTARRRLLPVPPRGCRRRRRAPVRRGPRAARRATVGPTLDHRAAGRGGAFDARRHVPPPGVPRAPGDTRDAGVARGADRARTAQGPGCGVRGGLVAVGQSRRPRPPRRRSAGAGGARAAPRRRPVPRRDAAADAVVVSRSGAPARNQRGVRNLPRSRALWALPVSLPS